MSLFGTNFPMATTQQQATLSGALNLFGTPSTAAAAVQQPAFGAFGSPATSSLLSFSTPAPAASQSTNLTFGIGGFGQQIQPQPQLQLTSTAAPALGLGGARTDVSLSGTQMMAPAQSVKTPKETDVPQEIIDVVNALKERIKENRNTSEAIASIDPKCFDQIETSYRSAAIDYGKAVNTVQEAVHAAKVLKDESRQDLLDGEMAQRLKDSAGANFEYAAPLNFLLRRAAHYEKLIALYAEGLGHLEKLIMGQRKPITAEDLTAHMKRVDSAFRYVSTQVHELDKKLQEVKDAFKDYRRSIYGDAARFLPSKTQSQNSSLGKFERIEGPSPFAISSHNAMLVVANALCRAQAGTGMAPNIGLPVPQQFGTQPLVGFGTQPAPQPFATSQTLFRPFGSSARAPTAAVSAIPFASGTLSFTSGLGAGATTAAPSVTTTTATASPWRFSSPFNTSSSGTLFGGSATNVGTVKPLGLATPLQGGSPATTSLQLLNPPLGSKRGKS